MFTGQVNSGSSSNETESGADSCRKCSEGMPSSARGPAKVARSKPRATKSEPAAEDQSARLLALIAELQSEVATLKAEMACLRTEPATPRIAVSESKIQQMLERTSAMTVGDGLQVDAAEFAAELQNALAHPVTEPEEDMFSDEYSGSWVDDMVPPGIASETQDSVDEAASATDEPQDKSERVEALATSEEGEAAVPVVDTNNIEEAPGDGNVTEPAESSDDNATDANSDWDGDEAQIVSAAEIQALLGIKDPAEDEGDADEPTDREPDFADVSSAGLEGHAASDNGAPPGTVVTSADGDDAIELGEIDSATVARIPGSLAANALAIPVCVVDDTLHVLAAEPFDAPGIEAIGKTIGLPVVTHAAPIDRVLAEIRSRYGSEDDSVVRLPGEPRASKPSVIARILRRSA